MRIAVTGSSGMVGTELKARAQDEAVEIIPMVRSRNDAGIYWNASKGEIDSASLEGIDAVIHIAGENIADGRWTDAKKARIRDSRVDGTKLISSALAKLNEPPKVFVSASAIGYYGNRGDEVLTESSSAGSGFLAEVCKGWEAATADAVEAGIRNPRMRIGVILAKKGGALGKMLPPFRMGAGGKLGSGNQYMSWIHIDDVVGAIYFAVKNEQLDGPANTVAPNPVTNLEFTKTLGKVLNRPTIIPLPAFMAKIMLGEMAEELLLSSTRVVPNALQAAGYSFSHPQLEGSLRDLLK